MFEPALGKELLVKNFVIIIIIIIIIIIVW